MRYRDNFTKRKYMTNSLLTDWAGPNGELGRYIAEEAKRSLNSYREQPNLVAEHANVESDTVHGGYAHRQLFELIQNSADALSPDTGTETADEVSHEHGGGHIAIHLTENHLYCADNGEPINRAGVKALMFSRLSPKRATSQIGTFGRGFKSVLGVSNTPEFFSRSGSFRFDGDCSRERIQEVVPDAAHCPVLRLPEPLDPAHYRDEDDVLHEFMAWATNIVRLPLKSGAHKDLYRQMRDFPTEFLLFVEHVRTLTLMDNSSAIDRTMNLEKVGDEYHLTDGSATSRWKRFERMHRLSADAQADRRPGDERKEVPIWWAAPLERLDKPGKFWAFFPTDTASLVAGILNAPWKTNEDRQNLLRGPYNEELIESAAEMIADSLPKLVTDDDPACHLDALPRGHKAGDSEQAKLLRERLFSHLCEREIAPDQDGVLRVCGDLSYPPKDLTPEGRIDTELFERWATYPGRPPKWLHHKALTLIRLATIDRLFQPQSGWSAGAPRATIAKWLEALVQTKEPDNAVRASMAAVQIAARIPSEIRTPSENLGSIVLTAAGTLQKPDPECLFRPSETMTENSTTNPEYCVHPALASDKNTLAALKKLGIKSPSPESNFRFAANQILQSYRQPEDNMLENFWRVSRELTVDDALGIIQEFRNWTIRTLVRTLANEWQPLHSVLLPGMIVPGNGCRDGDAAIDMEFHEIDSELLRKLGAVDAPENDRNLSPEPWMSEYQKDCKLKWRRQYPNEASSTKSGSLVFQSHEGIGPLHILEILSDEDNAAYTKALLDQEATYQKWTMWHKNKKGDYPKEKFDAPAIWMLRKHGRINTPDGIVPLADALGPHPPNPTALNILLRHPKGEKIKAIFKLAEPTPEFFGEDDPIPLTDIWPNLNQYLPAYQRTCRLIRCERILVADQEKECIIHSSDFYLADIVGYDEDDTLRLISVELGLELSPHQLDAILQRKTPQEIEERRTAIRQCSTDAERLLAAVGKQALRTRLSCSLLTVLENEGVTLTGIEIAEAAIATYHTDALRQYRRELDRLNPPSKWAGSAPAVLFVRSLGFSAEWAGERNRKRDPFLEIEGPYSLPALHGYQETIAGNVRELLLGKHGNGNERRGMISMPTGSGKTRVAVQAIVEAMRDDGFRGGVLWIADRDELCEQAVVAWRQAWSSLGTQSSRLRISRMWGGQSPPQPTGDPHVIVATLQTLNAKFSNRRDEYESLKGFKLVVFDEAHRSIAPSATLVMQEIGLTRWQKTDEPFLLGLTATPYRGHDEDETKRLARRYGSRRLDSGAFTSDDPQKVIRELQDMGVLAQADHKRIDGGTFRLNPEEWQKIEKFRQGRSEVRNLLAWLPTSVEDRIASDAERTKRIIQAYETHIERDWPTLIFATSVEHAQTVAALLNWKGITSRAVSGNTETATRRRVVEEFRHGDIKALVNYGVFREGFDAPRTRAIIVARPVYSPNLYFQMIGRGLRGPLNGGVDWTDFRRI